MSRSYPNKKKRSCANEALLFFGEGLSEEIFLRHLKSLYSRNSGKAIMVRGGKGGTPYDIVVNASLVRGSFTQIIVVFDNDKSKVEMKKAHDFAKKNGIIVIENEPCLEALFLEILSYKCKEISSSKIKKEFEKRFIDKKKRDQQDECAKLFPKSLLDKKRTSIKTLNRIMSIMSGE